MVNILTAFLRRFTRVFDHRLLTTLLASVAAAGTASAAGFDPAAELYRLDRLPVFKDSVKIGSVSSYDRTGGNDDGFSGKYSFVRKDDRGLVLADLKGPGVIYRFATPTPTDDTLEFLFDGETTPRISLKYRDMFLGKHPEFPAPLVGFGAGGFYSYVPIPFAKSCVIRLLAPKAQFYQLNYAVYDERKGVATFTPGANAEGLRKAGDAVGRAGSDVSRWTAPPQAAVRTENLSASLSGKGAATVFEANSGGRIVGLRFSPADAFAGKNRDVLLRISFDGESPAVLCPAGDFFGYAWGEPATRSLLLGTAGATSYCYFPMPYRKSAKIELVSERDAPLSVQAEVLHAAEPRRPDEGGFYAHWRRENPTKIGEHYTLLNTTGRGHLAGLVLQSQGFESGKTLFFEGDDRTTIDGELVVHGTGSEDFFNGGWYDVPDRWEKRISFPLTGCLGYAKHLGRTGAYRLLLGDAYPYRRSLLQTIEHAGENNSIPTDYCSVTFFYSEGAPTGLEPMPDLPGRRVQDPKEVVFPCFWQTPIYAWSFDNATLSRKKEKLGNEEVRFLALSATGGDWFGHHFISPTCEVPAAGNYAIYIEAVKGPDQGRVQLFRNENPAGEPVDLYSESPEKTGRVLLGRLDLAEGRNHLMFKLVGKNEMSTGLGLNLVQIACVAE